MTGDTLLRKALDAHNEYENSRCHCVCGWSTTANDHHAAWLDHAEQVLRAALGDDHADLRQAVIEAAEDEPKMTLTEALIELRRQGWRITRIGGQP